MVTVNLQMDQSGTCPSGMSFRDCPSGYVLHIGRDWRDISGRNAGADSAINRSRHRGSEDISPPTSGAAGFSCSKFSLS